MRPWTVATVIVALSFSTSTFAQQRSLKEQIVGTWKIQSVTEDYGGGKVENSPFGPNVTGAFTFDPDGNFSAVIIGADLPNPSKKAQESDRQVVAYFGKYTVDDAANTVIYTAERATIPAFDGLARKASVTMSGDGFTQKSASVTGPQGTFTPTLVFKRAH